MSARILVVDDHGPSGSLLAEALLDEGHDAEAYTRGVQALAALRERGADLLITDLRMDELDGIALLREVKAIDPTVPVLVVTAYATVDRAVEATRAGAFSFLTKPIKLPELSVQVRNALEQRRLARVVSSPAPGAGEIVGRSVALLRALSLADRSATSEITVLITGESGTGKELFARRIHAGGARRAGPFIAVNCGAIPESLIEAELFGYLRGAFTGANRDRMGLIESANKGTLFLDEVGELSPGAQTRMLRFLQEGTIRPVGDVRDRSVDVRVLSATHRDLKTSGFREDLFYRLNVIPIQLPPLRERRDDLALLLGVALSQACARQQRPVPRISSGALDALQRHDWPGNVRELFNLADRLAVLCAGETIELADLPAEIAIEGAREEGLPLPEGDFELVAFLDEIEARALRRALARYGGVKAQAAASLGIERNSFRYKLKKHGIED